MIDKRIWEGVDDRLVIFAFVLMAIGLVNLFSATSNMPGEGLPFYLRQLIWFGIGVMFGAVVFAIDYRYYEELAYPLYLLCLLGVIAVLIYGLIVGGGQRWIKIWVFYLQPSELMKISLILALARFFVRHEREAYRLRDLIVPSAMMLIPAILVARQPDLGTAMVMTLITFSIFVFVGISLRSFLILCSLLFLATPLFWFMLKGYQRMRILAMLNPQLDPLGAGYHIIQARIAIGSGGLLGKGYLQGSQYKLNFLPEHHTDFIFAVLGEEWGFLGCAVVLALYLSLILWGLTRGIATQDRFGAIVAFGVVAMIFWHVVINVGMVLGVMPVVGLPLPLLSYGGSSAVATLIGIGLMLNVRARRHVF